MTEEKVKIEIPMVTLLKLTLFLLAVYLVFVLRSVIVLLFIVAILVAATRPVVKKWETKIGKNWSVMLLTLILFALIAGFFYAIVPPLVVQIKQLLLDIPNLTSRFSDLKTNFPSINQAISSLGNLSLGDNFISLTTGFLGGIVSFFTVIFLTIYFLLDEAIFSKTIIKLIPDDKKAPLTEMISKISEKVGNWLRGQLLLGLIVGGLVFIALSIIQVPYALALAVIAAVLEIIPIIGPFVSGTIAVLVALTVSPIAALIVLICYIVIQQLEGNLIVPKIMQKAIGLPPAIIILAILIGSKLLGVIGGLLAVPISGILYVIFQEWEIVKRLTK